MVTKFWNPTGVAWLVNNRRCFLHSGGFENFALFPWSLDWYMKRIGILHAETTPYPRVRTLPAGRYARRQRLMFLVVYSTRANVGGATLRRFVSSFKLICKAAVIGQIIFTIKKNGILDRALCTLEGGWTHVVEEVWIWVFLFRRFADRCSLNISPPPNRSLTHSSCSSSASCTSSDPQPYSQSFIGPHRRETWDQVQAVFLLSTKQESALSYIQDFRVDTGLQIELNFCAKFLKLVITITIISASSFFRHVSYEGGGICFVINAMRVYLLQTRRSRTPRGRACAVRRPRREKTGRHDGGVGEQCLVIQEQYRQSEGRAMKTTSNHTVWWGVLSTFRLLGAYRAVSLVVDG